MLAEVELSDWFSVSGGLGLVYRDRLNVGLDGSPIWRHDVYGGGGLRLEARRRIFVMGLFGDVLAAPTRHTGAPVLAAGLDLKFRMLTTAQAEERKERKARRKR